MTALDATAGIIVGALVFAAVGTERAIQFVLAFLLMAVTLALAVYAWAQYRWRRRARSLQYEVSARPRTILAEGFAQVTEAAVRLSWGSGSVEEWERRCEASLMASRRRRGIS